MSGIVGCLRKSGAEAAPQDLSRMMAAMAHWTADGSAIWRSGPAGLGCRVLAVTPEARREHLPAAHPRLPGLVITADARLDNRDELGERLGIPAAELVETPDSGLILLAYERWGPACVDHLLGAFAFAIRDASRGSLFCARDPLGERPFLYFDGSALFAFASDVRALLALPEVPERLDEEAMLAHYLGCPGPLKTRSFFQEIRKLPPGHTLTVTADATSLRRYWQPASFPELRLSSNEAYAEALLDQLQQATARCLRSAYPVGSHLSGGLDSSFVTALAARQLREEGRSLAGAYSWSPPPEPEDLPVSDERALVEAVAREHALAVSYTTVTSADVADYLARDFTVSPTVELLAELRVQQHAEGAGIRTLLSGWGGDEVVAFNGRGYFAELLAAGRWVTLVKEARARTRRHDGAVWADVAFRAMLPLLPDRAWRLLGRDRVSRFRRDLERHGWRLEDLGPHAQELLWDRWRQGRERRGVLAMQVRLLELGHLARRLEAWATEGATRGIEYRCPLLDRRLLEHCLALPSHQFFQRGWKRFGFRLAMGGLVPDAIRWNLNKSESSVTRRRELIHGKGFELFLQRRAGGIDAGSTSRVATHTTRLARIGALLGA